MQDDGTQTKGVFHHGGKTGFDSQRNGIVSEHHTNEKVTGGASEKSF